MIILDVLNKIIKIAFCQKLKCNEVSVNAKVNPQVHTGVIAKLPQV